MSIEKLLMFRASDGETFHTPGTLVTHSSLTGRETLAMRGYKRNGDIAEVPVEELLGGQPEPKTQRTWSFVSGEIHRG